MKRLNREEIKEAVKEIIKWREYHSAPTYKELVFEIVDYLDFLDVLEEIAVELELKGHNISWKKETFSATLDCFYIDEDKNDDVNF